MKLLFSGALSLGFVLLLSIIVSPLATAGGISLSGTRIIYPAGAKQASLSVHNTSSDAAYLVQSWTDNANGQKSTDFIVTPPLFVSNSGDENMLRLIFVGPLLPKDRETLYYFNSRAVPSVDKSNTDNKSVLMLSTTTRIKLFFRPTGLTPTPEKAPEMLSFSKRDGKLVIDNSSPYYITLVQMKIGGKKIDDVMVSPKSSTHLSLPPESGTELSYRAMNDYGGATPVRTLTIK